MIKVFVSYVINNGWRMSIMSYFFVPFIKLFDNLVENLFALSIYILEICPLFKCVSPKTII